MQHRHQALEMLIYIYIHNLETNLYIYIYKIIYSYNCQLFVAQLASQVVGAFSMEQQAWKSLFFVQCTVSLFQGCVFEMWNW